MYETYCCNICVHATRPRLSCRMEIVILTGELLSTRNGIYVVYLDVSVYLQFSYHHCFPRVPPGSRFPYAYTLLPVYQKPVRNTLDIIRETHT